MSILTLAARESIQMSIQQLFWSANELYLWNKGCELSMGLDAEGRGGVASR